ncbi:MAG: hypothetical protein PHX20_00370 [Candidatus Omnitrophica bacterium]|nr:hypothetical protein [Candidatus Omnitrophota bacterium]
MELKHRQWDIKKFKSLVKAKYGDSLLSRVETYIITLDWKNTKAQYHADKVDEYWGLLVKKLGWVLRPSHPYFLEAQYRSAFEMEAMIQTLHSLGDLFAQIVNVTVYGVKLLDEHKVSLKHIFKGIPGDSPLRESMQNLSASPEYEYFDGFCNTVKHRRLIDVDYCIYTGHRRREGQTGFRFKEFVYNNKEFKATAFAEIKNNYKNDLFEKFRDVGIELNNFLAKNKYNK